MDAVFPIRPSDLGPSEWLYLVTAAAVVLASFVLLFRPFANLALTIFFLGTANVAILGTFVSAIIATVLIANGLMGIVLNVGPQVFAERKALLVPATLGSIAVVGLANGFAHGNLPSLVLGDFYQAIELPLLFLLARALVTTEQRFRTMVWILIGSIMAASTFQIADALTGAGYLPHLREPDGSEGLLRLVNNNDPIAFSALLGALPMVRRKAWLLAALVFVEVNIILSFTRGIWAATLAAGCFLLLTAPRARLTILGYGAAAGVFAIAFVYVSGLGEVAFDRIAYTVQQLRAPEQKRPPPPRESTNAQQETARASSAQDASGPTLAQGAPATTPAQDAPGATPAAEERQTLSGRRRLEFILIVPEILAHPLLGKGLGATYQISGDAILEGPKGQRVNHHFIHNIFVQLGFRLGVPALLAFIAILWIYFRAALATVRAAALWPVYGGLAAGLVAAVFGEFVFSFTSPIFFNHPMAGLVGCIMGMTMTKLPDSAPATQSPALEPARA
jgi:O-Antigen ligase